MLTDDILSRSAADIVTLYRSKRLSPVDVLTAMLDRIDRLDRLYNAFVVIDRDIPPARKMHQQAGCALLDPMDVAGGRS